MADSIVKLAARVKNFDAVISSVIMGFVLLGYAFLGFFVRPDADDFCFAVHIHSDGILGSIYDYYQGYFGRFSQVALTGIFSYIGPYGSQLSPAVLLAGLVSGTWYALRPFTRYAFFLSLAGVYAFVLGLPTPWETLYWQSAAHTYIAPLVVAAFMYGLILRQKHPSVIALLGFFASGFNEGFSPVLFASLIILWFVRRDMRPATSAAILGVGIGSLILFAAPGNFARSATANNGLHPPLLKAAYLASREGFLFLLRCGFATIGPLLLTGIMAVCAFPEIQLSRKRRIVLMLICIFAAIGLSCLNLIPALWAIGIPAGRVYTANVVILLLLAISGFVIFGLRVPNWLMIVLAITTAIPSLYTLMNTASRLVPYAQEFDKGHITTTFAEIAGGEKYSQPECYKAWKMIWFPESTLSQK